MFNVNDLLEEAIKETEELQAEEIFLLKDLFKGYVWHRIPLQGRLLLGTLFLNYVHHNTNCGLQAIEKTSSHQQRYRKMPRDS